MESQSKKKARSILWMKIVVCETIRSKGILHGVKKCISGCFFFNKILILTSMPAIFKLWMLFLYASKDFNNANARCLAAKKKLKKSEHSQNEWLLFYGIKVFSYSRTIERCLPFNWLYKLKWPNHTTETKRNEMSIFALNSWELNVAYELGRLPVRQNNVSS